MEFGYVGSSCSFEALKLPIPNSRARFRELCTNSAH